MRIEDVYAEIAPKLTNYLLGNGLSYATTCDIVQETFLRVWKRRDELKDDMSQVSGLVFTIARNYRNDLAKKQKRENLQGEITDADYGENEAAAVSPDRRLEENERAGALRQFLKGVLDEMPTPLLEAFLLVRFGNMSVAEVAQQLGISESNVKVRTHRARELFRGMLRMRDDESDGRTGGRGAGLAKRTRGLVGTAADGEGFGLAVLRTMMMLAAVDGQIAKEELAGFKALAAEMRTDGAAFDEAWRGAVRKTAYICIQARQLAKEELARVFVEEAREDFLAAAKGETPEGRKRALARLETLAAADGDYSEIERLCIGKLRS